MKIIQSFSTLCIYRPPSPFKKRKISGRTAKTYKVPIIKQGCLSAPVQSTLWESPLCRKTFWSKESQMADDILILDYRLQLCKNLGLNTKTYLGWTSVIKASTTSFQVLPRTIRKFWPDGSCYGCSTSLLHTKPRAEWKLIKKMKIT